MTVGYLNTLSNTHIIKELKEAGYVIKEGSGEIEKGSSQWKEA